jgi:hypothetical protein
MPANAGIQVRSRSEYKNAWIPACAGMTETEVDFQSTNLEPLGLEPRVVQLSRLGSRRLKAGYLVRRVYRVEKESRQ